MLKVDSYGVTLGVFEAGASGDGLAVDSLGEKLYVSRGVDVAVLDAQTGQQLALLSGSVPGGSEFVNAAEIDLDSFGNVYVADTVALVIKVYGADNQYVTSLGAPGVGAGFFGTLAGIVISPTN
ncbi:MAG: hypothetical protein OET90_06505, partial [Desulfuromonadales bacterium]|nr:hypothetical protein [Desulfuromonadales bacterium]